MKYIPMILFVLLLTVGMTAYISTFAKKLNTPHVATKQEQLDSLAHLERPFLQKLERVKYATHAILINGDIENIDISHQTLSSSAHQGTVTHSLAFCYTHPGYYLTAYHCIKKSQSEIALVQLSPLKVSRKVQVLWKDERLDIALLYTPELNQSPIEVASEPDLHIDAPLFSLGQTLAHGVINETLPEKIHHSAPVKPGDSGSAIVNAQRKLIAVNQGIFCDLPYKEQVIKALRLQSLPMTSDARLIPHPSIQKEISKHQLSKQ